MPFWTATGHLSECARRDLETYRDFWPALLLMESEAPYGIVHGDVRAPEGQGTCVSDATLRRTPDGHIEARWGDDRGQAMAVGEVVVISKTHPSVDALARSSIVSKQVGGLLLSDNGSTPCGDGTWRLDMEVNYVTYDRLCEAARAFATEECLGSCRSVIQLLAAPTWAEPWF